MNHNTPFKKTVGNILLSGLIFAVSGCATHSIQSQSTEPHIVLQTQGSFAQDIPFPIALLLCA
ncbi:hypothetical protein FEK49_11500 [Escherichia sp. E4385]|nr:hypothetical protein CRI66_24380 [Escherichia sp. E4694]TGC12928.1 hypothetical protein CRU79_20625 [Escherichia sp. E4385]TLJ01911.1 hypothetical protein FEK49_11500 [Escherichia sp. E4385]